MKLIVWPFKTCNLYILTEDYASMMILLLHYEAKFVLNAVQPKRIMVMMKFHLQCSTKLAFKTYI